jgi:signal transduction histidine kinase
MPEVKYDHFTPRFEGSLFPPRYRVHWFSMASSSDKSSVALPGQGPKDRFQASAPAQDAATNPADDPLEALEQLRDRFRKTTNALASAAHDLKTPLAILNGYIELLQSQKLGPLNERQREVMGDMFLSGQRLQQFIQDFLTFSVLETGEMRMQYVEGDINECLSEVCRLWSSRFQERGLALYFLANDKLTPFAFDAPKIQRVISNLLENASKYTKQGGTVWLHAEPHMWERRSVSISTGGDRRRQSLNLPNAVKVSVADTGPGIRPEFHLEIFDDFFRLPGSESADGMGLGLAIARRLLQGMSGKIWVESEPGAGCKFSFLIPTKPILSIPARGTK